MPLPVILGALAGAGGAGGAGGITAALGASGATSQAIGQVAGKMQQLGGTMKGIANPIATFDMATSKLHSTLSLVPNKILQVKELITSTFATFTAAFAAPIDAINEMGLALGRFVKLSSPATFERFTFAVENTFSTIGKIVEPILRSLTAAANKMGDIFAKLEPAFRPAIRAIEILIDVGMQRFAAVAEAAAPMIYRASILFLGLAKAIEFVEKATRPLVSLFGFLNRQINAILGIGSGFNPEGKQNMAVRNVGFMSSEEIQRKTATESIKASIGAGPGKEEQAWDATISLPQILGNIRDLLMNLPTTVLGYLRDLFIWLLENGPRQIGEAIKGVLPNLPGSETRKEAASWLERRGDDLNDAGKWARRQVIG